MQCKQKSSTSQTVSLSTLTSLQVNMHLRFTYFSFLTNSYINCFYTSAPSMVELSVVNKSTSSICISWIVDRGVVSGFALSINSVTAKHVLISIHQEHRSFSAHKSYDMNDNQRRLRLKSPFVLIEFTPLKVSLQEPNIQLK